MKFVAVSCLAVLAACGIEGSIGEIGTLHDGAGIDVAPEGPADASQDAPPDDGNAGGACVQREYGWRRFHVDVFVLLDASGSMNCPISDSTCDDSRAPSTSPSTRWKEAVAAVDALVSTPHSGDHRFGLGLLSGGSSPSACDPNMHLAPLIPITPPPDGPGFIMNFLATWTPAGDTPMAPYLLGAIGYAQLYAQETPYRSAVILLVTDGSPNGCDSTLASTAMFAAAGFRLGIKTFVIGVSNTAELDEVALNGSGGLMRALAPSPDLAARLDALLHPITSADGCDFVVPSMTDQSLDYGATAVRVTIEGSAPMAVDRVDNASACTQAGGWYYDVSPPQTPTKVTLCPQTCEVTHVNDAGRVELSFGCLPP